MRKRWAAWCLALAPLAAHALEPTPMLSQVAHTAWRVQEGILNGAATSLAQTADGYLWIGTRNGLYRFDGARMTELAPPADEEPLRSPRVVALHAAQDGALWIGTGNDLERWDQGHLAHYPAAVGAIFGLVNHVDQARDGTIWMVRGRISDKDGPLCKVVGSALKCFDAKAGVDLPYAIGFLEDEHGAFWLHSDDRILHWDPTTLQSTKLDLASKVFTDGIQTMIRDRDGSILIGTALAKRSIGLSRMKGAAIEAFESAGLDGRKLAVQQLLLDSRGSLWIGTQNEGIYRIAGGRVDRFRSTDGLSSDTINALFEDREGNIWVATSQGVDRFRDVRVLSYSSREGLTNDLVNGVVASRDGAVWLSNFHAIDIIDGGVVKHLAAGDGLPGEEVASMFEDRQGRMWVGIDDGLMRYDGGTFRPVTGRGGRTRGRISSIMDDERGDVWVVTRDLQDRGVLVRVRDDRFEETVPVDRLPVAKAGAVAADRSSGIWLPLANGDIAHWHDARVEVVPMGRAPLTGNVTSIVSASDGTVYASSSLGVAGIRDGRTQALTMASGLPCTIVYSMLVDQDALWLYIQCGLLAVSQADLDRWWRDPSHRVQPRQIGALDGAQPAAASFSPRSSRSPDGRLWFANSSVLQVFDPSHEPSNAVVPPVLIERLVADRRSYRPGGGSMLPPLANNLQIDYTGLSLAVPEKVNFRYRLEGFDADWVDARTRRQAFYTNLGPGSYVFRVTASNNDGVWNTVGASAPFTIEPAFHQRLWFHALCAVAIVAALWMLYLARIRQVNARLRLQLEAQTDERERIARELHDTLLQGMQGLIFSFQAGTERLPASEPTRAMMEAALVRADRMLADGRDHVSGLRTAASDASLVRALEDVAIEVTRGGVETRVTVEGDERPIRVDAARELVRIASEAIGNAVRHASASRIDVVLRFDRDAFTLRVGDDGVGFDASRRRDAIGQSHFGLVGIEERAVRLAGTCTIESRPGRGTDLQCRLPAARVYASGAAPTWYARLRGAVTRRFARG